MFRFRALGTGTVALSPARSCSGYVVETDDALLLVDCGSGITRRLAELEIEWHRITHIAITHFHLDHYADLPTLLYAFRYGMLPVRSAPLAIIGPVGTAALFERLAAAYGDFMIAPVYPQTIREIEPGQTFDLTSGGRPTRLSAFKVPHTEESVAYSIERGGRRIVYTGDTGVSPELGEWAKGCDLLVAECSLPESMAIPSHLTPEQVGELGRIAQPGMLALTHFYPPVEHVDVQAAVRGSYAGPLTLAHDGWAAEFEER
ncbi:MAG TPA: ribonuclease Z [Gemmatimonadaceae bacterium]|nr:ribonuclease Z [Gemmatimonadaceae bacterium]